MKQPWWRFIPFRFFNPDTNMAYDEAMFQMYSHNLIPPTLRIYGWHPAGVSFGYFQDASIINNIKEGNVPYVRRMTGGGMIYHKDDISYSIICSRSDLNIKGTVDDSYRILCSFLIRFYESLELKAEFSGYKEEGSDSGGLCCMAKERYDITIKGRKIGGNAQRRRKDIVFQHGSIPLKDISDEVNELSGMDVFGLNRNVTSLDKELNKKIDCYKAAELLKESFQNTFNLSFKEIGFTKQEEELKDELLNNKYSTSRWNLARLFHVVHEIT